MVSKTHQNAQIKVSKQEVAVSSTDGEISHLISHHHKTFEVTEVALSFNRVLLRITLRGCFKKVTKHTKHTHMFIAKVIKLQKVTCGKKRIIKIMLPFHKYKRFKRNCTLMPTPVLILVSNKWFANSRWQLPILALEIPTLLIYNRKTG